MNPDIRLYNNAVEEESRRRREAFDRLRDAAAPKLLAACKVALSLNEGTHTHITAESVNRRLRDAIAAAEPASETKQ